MDRKEQSALLTNFVAYASQQALVWQHSQARLSVTNQKFINGNNNPEISTKIPAGFEKVKSEFLTAWGLQGELFGRLIRALAPHKPESAVEDVDWIRANSNIRNFEFRGYRMKSGKLIPDEFDIRWLIFYDTPHLLQCCTSKNEPIGAYNLVEQGYFDLTPDQQVDALDKFVKEIFQ